MTTIESNVIANEFQYTILELNKIVETIDKEPVKAGVLVEKLLNRLSDNRQRYLKQMS